MKINHRLLNAGAALMLVVFVFSTAPLAIGETAGINEPADAEKITTRTERLKVRKDEFKAFVTEESKKRLALKCSGAQKPVSSLKIRDETNREKYQKAYIKTADRLNEIIIKLQQRGLSTAGLQNARQQLADSINTYLANAEAYRAAINDLAAMDCDKDIEGWITTLEAARSQRKLLAENAATIKQNAKQVKKELIAAKAKLEEAN